MLDETFRAEKIEATDYSPLPDDMYQVELLDITAKSVESYDSKQARAKDQTLAPIMENVLNFQFTLLDGEEDGKALRGRNLWQHFVPAYLYIGSKHGKNKLYNIVEALYGRNLSPAEEAFGISGKELNALIGKQCRVVTKNKVQGDKTYTNIDSFLPAKTMLAELNATEREDATVKPKDAEATEATETTDLTEKDAPFN